MLIPATSDPELTLLEFCAITTGLRTLMTASPDSLPRVIDHLRGRVSAASAKDWTRIDASVQKLVHRLETAGKQCLHLSEVTLAGELGRSPKALSALLAREIGLSFRRLRRVVVMWRAAHLLTETDEQVAPIAYAVGYDDQSSFDHSFERVFGLSPTRFRKLAGASRGRSWSY